MVVNLVICLTSLLFYDNPLLYYYINLRSSIIFCLFSGGTYLSLGTSLSNPIFSVSFVTVSELICGEVFETFVNSTTLFLSNHQMLLLFSELPFLKQI